MLTTGNRRSGVAPGNGGMHFSKSAGGDSSIVHRRFNCPAERSEHLEKLLSGLNARSSGSQWVAKCPAHRDGTPSLSIGQGSDGRPLVHCFGGCTQDRLLGVLRGMGLWPWLRSARQYTQSRAHRPQARQSQTTTSQAATIWDAAGPIEGTLAARYLTEVRRVQLPEPNLALRFHADAPYFTSERFPALVAAVTNARSGEFQAVQLTYLQVRPDGVPSKIGQDRDRKFVGPIKNGVIRLCEPDDYLALCEGLETGLSVQQETGEPTWVALSASNLLSLEIAYPDSLHQVGIYADNDASGVGQRAARACAERFASRGLSVDLVVPKVSQTDFNDIVREVGHAA